MKLDVTTPALGPLRADGMHYYDNALETIGAYAAGPAQPRHGRRDVSRARRRSSTSIPAARSKIDLCSR